jgi:hypothetical protein
MTRCDRRGCDGIQARLIKSAYVVNDTLSCANPVIEYLVKEDQAAKQQPSAVSRYL